ncbi:MAG: type II toxin-antitoxin system Phd/YefM family antitoxin [Proteobacteria bacterium]|nr:type II toxin-antitoxin system Phd/YefM family antitoxin [Pseudomonadota bacterium]
MDQFYSLSEAKAKFSEIINRIIFRNERFVITKKGKAVAQVSPICQSEDDGSQEGLIRARGCLDDLSENDIDEIVEQIYETRYSETDRKVGL